MNALVIYYTQFGNTQMVAESVAEALVAAGTVRVISSDRLTASDLDGVDLVVMGSPTHRMNLPEAVQPVFERLPRRALRGKRTAAFDTSYEMSRWLTPFTAARRLGSKLRKLGGDPVVPPETFHVVESQGPLVDSEIEHAREWARSILHLMEAQSI